MTPSTLQALRRLLFFSAPEAAELIGGVTERSWRFWEDGKRPIPDDVAKRIRQLVEWRREKVNEWETRGAVVWYPTMADWLSLGGRDAVLWRPYCSVVAELCANYHTEAIEFLGADYVQWLGRRHDSDESRHAWASVQALVSK